MAEPALRLAGLTRRFGSHVAVDGVDLDVAPGEFVTLLGPSGCGKTTTLNMIAGFLAPDAGRIVLAGRQVEDLPPFRRDLGMVFQDYALFPHMTVAENVAFGLRMRGVAASAAATGAMRAAHAGVARMQSARSTSCASSYQPGPGRWSRRTATCESRSFTRASMRFTLATLSSTIAFFAFDGRKIRRPLRSSRNSTTS